jgi:peptidoglycan/LPS O-acetylase OafA/YrhL
MVPKTYDDPRIVRFDMTKAYATIMATVLWALTCGLLMAVYLHDPRTDQENWRPVMAFGFLALIAPVLAYKNHPHAWPTLYAVMGLMLMYASMMAR